MDRTDLSEQDWLQHAYEEALDLAIYLKKIIKTKQNEKVPKGFNKWTLLEQENYLTTSYRKYILLRLNTEES